MAAQSIPDNVRTWTVTDVARWLDALTLSQYSSAFIEASVDGPFLLEVRKMIEKASLYPTYYDVCPS